MSEIHSIVLILAAPFIGSFLGVLHARLPAHRDIVFEPSRCDQCGAQLSAAEMIPLFSFWLQKGRCRSCGATLPHALWMFEGAALGIALAATALAPDGLSAFGLCVLGWVLLPLATIDWRHQILPDLLTASLFVAGLSWMIATPAADLHYGLISAVAGAGSFWLIRAGYSLMRGREGLGMGDVKLMAGLGLWVGLLWLPLMVLIAASLALGFAVFAAWRTGKPLSGSTALPFGTFLCAASFATSILTIVTGQP